MPGSPTSWPFRILQLFVFLSENSQKQSSHHKLSSSMWYDQLHGTSSHVYLGILLSRFRLTWPLQCNLYLKIFASILSLWLRSSTSTSLTCIPHLIPCIRCKLCWWKRSSCYKWWTTNVSHAYINDVKTKAWCALTVMPFEIPRCLYIAVLNYRMHHWSFEFSSQLYYSVRMFSMECYHHEQSHQRLYDYSV